MGVFGQDGAAVEWRGRYETVRIEPWGADSLRVRGTIEGEIRDGLPGALLLWVPNTVSPHATWEYSWIRPPSRSCRRTRILVPTAGRSWCPAGGFWCSVRWGRCVLY